MRAAPREVALVAVGVADGERGDARGLRGPEGAPVADAVTRGRGAQLGDAGLPSHRGAEPRLEFRARRAAVEHQPGAHHVAGEFREADDAGAVLHMHHGLRDAEGAEPGGGGVKTRELLAGEGIVLISDGQMRGEAGDAESGQREDFAHGGVRVAFPDADAAHAGVDFHMHGERLRAGERGVVARFLDAANRRHKAVLDDLRSLLRERRAEDENRGVGEMLPHFHRLADICDAKHFHPPVERSHHRPDSVAVGVRLDHSHDLHLLAEVLPDGPGVVPQRIEVDLRPAAVGSWGAAHALAGSGGMSFARHGEKTGPAARHDEREGERRRQGRGTGKMRGLAAARFAGINRRAGRRVEKSVRTRACARQIFPYSDYPPLLQNRPMLKPFSVTLALLGVCAATFAQEATSEPAKAKPGFAPTPNAEQPSQQKSPGVLQSLFGSRKGRRPLFATPPPKADPVTPAPAEPKPGATAKKPVPAKPVATRKRKPAPKVAAEVTEPAVAKPDAPETPDPAIAKTDVPETAEPKVEKPKPSTPAPTKTARKGKTPPAAKTKQIVEPPADADPETKENFRFEQAKAKASEDPEVLELKAKADGAVSDEEARSAQRAYNKALFGRMRKIDGSLAERINQMEAAILKRLEDQ